MAAPGVTYLNQLPELPELQEINYGGNHGFGQFPQPGPVHSQPREQDYSKFIRKHDRHRSEYGGGAPSPSSGADRVGPGGYLTQESFTDPEPVAVKDDNYDFDTPSTSAEEKEDKACTCRDVFDHVNGCNICKAFYMEGRNNFMLYLIILVLVLIIIFLLSKVYDIHLKRPK